MGAIWALARTTPPFTKKGSTRRSLVLGQQLLNLRSELFFFLAVEFAAAGAREPRMRAAHQAVASHEERGRPRVPVHGLRELCFRRIRFAAEQHRVLDPVLFD